MTLLDTNMAVARHAAPDQAQQLRDLIRRQQADRPAKAAPASSSRPAVMPVVPRESPPAPLARVSRRAKVIAITSGKGGVGKTNVAVNLAARFAQAGKATVMLDADMGLANADVLCGLQLPFNLAHVIARRKRLSEVLADAPGGFRLAAGATGLARMADLPPAEHARLIECLAALEQATDLILIDTGAGISSNVLSFTRAADRVLVVTTPEPTAITDAYATIKVILRDRPEQARDGISQPISLLVNQARNATEAKLVFDRVAKVARQFLGATIEDAGFLPLDAAVTRAVRARVPFVVGQPKSAVSAAITRLAIRLEAGIAANLPVGTAGAPRRHREAGGGGGTGANGTDGFFGRLGQRLRFNALPPAGR